MNERPLGEERTHRLVARCLPYYEGSDGSHDLDHVERVHRNALFLGERMDARLDILSAAALLHDIGRPEEAASKGGICHAARGAELARPILEELGFSHEDITAILHCISAHRYRGATRPATLEARILFDADKLDSIGAIGIGRAFLFAGRVGARLHNPELDPQTTRSYSQEDTAYREFQVKLRRVRDRMLTPVGQQLARERHGFMERFFARIDREFRGPAAEELDETPAGEGGTQPMATKVKAIILTGFGTNCEVEMAHACRLAGADQADIVHISELLHGEYRLDDYQFLNLPGGFLDGDDLGAGQAGAHRIRYAKVAPAGQPLIEHLLRFIQAGKLVLGVCNGFQLMVKLGLLPGFDQDYHSRRVSLSNNDSGRFEDRWVTLRSDPASPCVFTRGLDAIELPVRHGEGKLMVDDEAVMRRIEGEHLACLRYIDPKSGRSTMDYPLNPNGSPGAIAGLCDPTGRVFGLMPHPEAFLHRTNHPRWTREELPEEGQGLALFRNAVEFLRRQAW